MIREIESPSLQINEEKTVLATKKYKRMIIGLIISNDGEVSIGRDRKRAIRAALHHAALGKLDADEMRRLGGLLAFTKGVDPVFFDAMITRYGGSLISLLQTIVVPPKLF